MAAFEIGGDLDFINGDEGDIDIARHGLDGRYPILGEFRFDFLFAGDEGDGILADTGDNAAIDFAGEQAEWQANDSGRMGQHALDGEIGLAGIGGTEHGFDTSGAQRRGKLGQGHGRSNLHFMDASTDRSGGECPKTGQKNGAALTLRTGAERTMSESLTSGRKR